MQVSSSYRSMVVFLCASMVPFATLYAYEVDTHANITRAAILRSVLSDALTLKRIGLYSELDATWLLRPDNGVYAASWANGAGARADMLLELAVRKEDDGLRSLQHFFDPQNDRGQTVTRMLSGEQEVVGLRSWQWVLDYMPDWEDVPSNSLVAPSEQYFTAKHAKDYLEYAVTEVASDTRRRRYGQFLTAIGHVIHHVQDMAQPDHVRNDSHCNARHFCVPAEILAKEDVYDPSEYEPFVKEQGYAAFNQWDYPIPAFNSYLDFWTNPEHAGMADFTNRFAVSKDTNFRGDFQAVSNHPEFPFPDGASAVTGEAVMSVTLMDGVTVSYTHTEVRAGYSDNYLGSPVSNSHITASHSLFALDIEAADLLGYDISVVSDAGYSMGRKTYESAASQLLPRAEAYSAGLINYMLRGRLGVQAPDRGYYALSDFAPGNAFSTLRFQLRNETPDVQPSNRAAIPQNVGAGELVAVVSYRPNPCYEDDLSGELHHDEPTLIPSGCSFQAWQALDEVRVTSLPIVVTEISRDWTEYDFDFSATPIPFSARDVEVYFVFRGDLGSEEEAIIVERKNISEPTYYTAWNSSDWVWTDSGWEDGYTLLSNSDTYDDILAAQYHDMSYDFDLNDPHSTGPDRLQAGRFHRIAALVDADAYYLLRYRKTPERYLSSNRSFSWNPLLNETREVAAQRVVYWFGLELHGPLIYSNRWCDDQGCTLSGLTRWRGMSRWSMIREYYVDGFSLPDPTDEDWEVLRLKTGGGQLPVTVHE